MKNLFYLSVLVLTAGLAACASDEVNEGRNYNYAGQGSNCGEALIQPAPAPMPAPAPACTCPVSFPNCGCQQPVVAPRCTCPSAIPSCGCPATEYTVRTPVKVVYQNTTYRTVYEPRTFQTTTYETQPYTCNSGICVR